MIKTDYKNHIDGLRAISIIAIITYHLNLSLFQKKLTGGYIGVDIFFVISGYLISKILFTKVLLKKKIDILNFYQGRIRRILPAYLCMLFIVLAVGNLFLIRTQIIDLIYSALSSIIFSVNYFFYFFSKSYYDPSTLYRPLVHLWSLSVEGQFYLFIPILFIIFKKKLLNFNYLFIIFIFTIASCIATYSNPNFSFYSIASRIFQFLIGITAYFYEVKYKSRIHKLQKFNLDLIALILLFLSFVFFNEKTFHPSIITTIPCVATGVLIVMINKNNITYKFLTFPVIRFIGLISFSLYIWHYPILSYARIAILFPTYDKIFLTLFFFIIFPLFSYFIIEKPFRDKNLISNKKLNIFIICLIIINILLCVLLYKKKENPNNIPILEKINLEEKYIHSQMQNFENYNKNECGNREKNFCSIIKDSKFTNIIFLGDSMTQQLIPDFISRDLNINIHDLTYSGMIYLPGFDRIIKNKKTTTQDYHLNRIKFINNLDNSIVIIFGRYNYIYNSNDYIKVNNKNNKINFEDSFTKSIEQLLKKNNKIFLIYPVPDYNFNVPNKIKQIFMFNRNKTFLHKEEISIPKSKFMNDNSKIFNFLDKLNYSNFNKFYPHEILCDKSRCYTHDQENLFYSDDVHLSNYIIKIINNNIVSKFNFLN
jgi:peptidoglycan/LPS O-acetylase OafA/YrhL